MTATHKVKRQFLIYQSAYQTLMAHRLECSYHSEQPRLWQVLIRTLAGQHSVHHSASDGKWHKDYYRVLTQCHCQLICGARAVTGRREPVLPAVHYAMALLLTWSVADGCWHRQLWRRQSAAGYDDSPSRRPCSAPCCCWQIQFQSTPAAAAHSSIGRGTENTARNRRLFSVLSRTAAPVTTHTCNCENTHTFQQHGIANARAKRSHESNK